MANSFFTKKGRGISNYLCGKGDDHDAEYYKEFTAIDAVELMRNQDRRVTMAVHWERPLVGSPAKQLVGIVHQGVVVTLDNGTTYLIHKAFDKESNCCVTVVTQPSNMPKTWRTVTSKKVLKSTLKNFIDICGDHYDTLTDNCIHAADRMMALP